MKKCFTFLLLLFCFTICHAQLRIEGRVVDAQTGEPLPYAKVYTESQIGTLTNSDGFFRLLVDDDVILKFHCIGYQPLKCSAKQANGELRMQPIFNQMQEITVSDYNMRELVRSVIEQLKVSYKKGRKQRGHYFYRTTFTNDNESELVEAFLKANTAVNLRNLAITNGIVGGDYGQDGNVGIASTNVHFVMQVAPRTYNSYRWDSCIKPFDNVSSFEKFYEARAESSGSGDEKIIKIEFKEKDKRINRKGKGLMVGTAYVRVADKNLLRFDGNILYQYMRSGLSRVPQEIKFSIQYEYSKGYAEISSLSIEGGGEFEPNILSHLSTFKYRTILFKIPGNLQDKKKGIKLGNEMMSVIKRADYDSDLWDKYDVIRRTEKEERIVFGHNLLARKSIKSKGQPTQHHPTDSTMLKLLERQSRFSALIPQEKVYVHMDNTSYFQGDTIWFAAYTHQTNTGTPSKVSGVLYVELLNEEGYLMERKMIPMSKGRGYGFFSLNYPIQYSGYYELRAYTRWQLNWGRIERPHGSYARKWFVDEKYEREYYTDYEKLYSRVFPVYDKPKDSEAPDFFMTRRIMRRVFKNNPDEKKMLLSFYPEGGNLVAGIENRVAFEVTWSDGEWIDGHLCINGDTVPTIHRGRGLFTFVPQKGEEYEIVFHSKDGKTQKGTLPPIITEGVALKVQREGNTWHITTETAREDIENLALSIMHEGKITDLVFLAGNKNELTIEENLLNAGVQQVTIFDNKGRIYADRLFFVRKEEAEKPKVHLNGLKDKYSPYERINFELNGTKQSIVSISVKDGYRQETIYDNANIMEEMLLASEIKGFVPNPGWYFEADDSLHRTGLDLLMMTQGWRRFDWKDMAIEGKWELSEPAEVSPIVQGEVINVNYYEIFDEEHGYSDKDVKALELPLEHFHDVQKRIYARIDEKSRTRIPGTHEMIIPLQLKFEDDNYGIELLSKNRTFKALLPLFMGESILSAAAIDFSNAKKDEELKWIIPIVNRNEIDGEQKERKEKFMEIERAKQFVYPVRIKRFSPHFSHAYNHYHTKHFDVVSKKSQSVLFKSSEIHQLDEVEVSAERNVYRRFDMSQPAMIIDAREGINLIQDYGINDQEGLYAGVVRALLGDYGLQAPYVLEEDEDGNMANQSRIKTIFGLSSSRRAMAQNSEIPNDSIYYRKYLNTFGLGFEFRHTEINEYTLDRLEKLVIYTDYQPRLSGSKRYSANNLPETRIALFPFSDGTYETMYINRNHKQCGFAYPAEFYNPDYSRQTPPDSVKDYRRTLYWNPNLMLDENGKATVTLYNCSNTTEAVVTTAGQAADGTLLWNE